MKLIKYFLVLLIPALQVTSSCKKVNVKPVESGTDSATKVIVVLGASTAVGWGASTFDSSWVGRLKKRLSTDHKNVKVVNLAIPGITTYQVSPSGNIVPNRPAPDTSANVDKAIKLKPYLVLINLPSNDIAYGYSDQEIMYNFDFITAALRNNNIPFILTGTQPRNLAEAAQRMRLKRLNGELITVYQNKVNDYLDQLSSSDYSILPVYSAGDGIHLNNNGHRVVYQAFMNHPLFKSLLNY